MGLGHTAYAFDTKTAVVRWATFLAVLPRRHLSISRNGGSPLVSFAMLWFGFVVAVVATVQTFTSHGKIFWLFPTGVHGLRDGPHFSTATTMRPSSKFVLPIAVYGALRRERDSLLYSRNGRRPFRVRWSRRLAHRHRLVTAETFVVIALMWARGRHRRPSVGAALLRMAVLFAVFASVVGMGERLEPFLAARSHADAAVSWPFPLSTWPPLTLVRRWSRHLAYRVSPAMHRRLRRFRQSGALRLAPVDCEGGIPFGIVMATIFLWCLRPAFPLSGDRCSLRCFSRTCGITLSPAPPSAHGPYSSCRHARRHGK